MRTVTIQYHHSASLKRLNTARVGFKHEGLDVTRTDVEAFLASVEAFQSRASLPARSLAGNVLQGPSRRWRIWPGCGNGHHGGRGSASTLRTLNSGCRCRRIRPRVCQSSVSRSVLFFLGSAPAGQVLRVLLSAPLPFVPPSKSNRMQRMWYCAYENWRRFRARVHCDGCGYLTPERLQRVRDGDIGPNDCWHDLGHFATSEEAMAEARRRLQPGNNYELSFCAHCLP